MNRIVKLSLAIIICIAMAADSGVKDALINEEEDHLTALAISLSSRCQRFGHS